MNVIHLGFSVDNFDLSEKVSVSHAGEVFTRVNGFVEQGNVRMNEDVVVMIVQTHVVNDQRIPDDRL